MDNKFEDEKIEYVPPVELFPLQKSYLKESKNELHESEKNLLKSKSPKIGITLNHIYSYANKAFSDDPGNEFKHPPSIYSVCNGHSTGSYFFGYSNGEIHLINSLTRISVHYTFDSILTCRIHPQIKKQTTLLALSCIGQIYYIHSTSGKQLDTFTVGDENEQRARCLELSPTGDKIAIGYKNGVIDIYDEKIHVKDVFLDNACIYSIGHVNQIHSLAFNKNDSNILISGGRDKRIVLWDLRKQNAVDMVTGPLTIGDSIDIKDNYIIGADYNPPGNIYCYDIRNIKTPLHIIKSETCAYCCKFSKSINSNLFGVGGYKGLSLQFYKDFQLVGNAEYCDQVYSLDFSKNGKSLVYGCKDGGVRMAELSEY